MISKLPRTNRNPQRKDKLFTNADDMRSCFYLQKKTNKRTPSQPKHKADTLPRIPPLEGNHRATQHQRPLANQKYIGAQKHKVNRNYIHLEKMNYQAKANDQFIVKVANTLDEAVKLREVGFEYHAEIEGHKLFKKRK